MWDCVFSVDVVYFVIASSDIIARLWDCFMGEVICVYSGYYKVVMCCVFNDSVVGDVVEVEISNE